MKHCIAILFLLFFKSIIAQQNDIVYLLFNSNSNETCNIPKSQRGRYHSEINDVNDVKIKQKDGKIDFYICNESFIWTRKSKIDTLSTKDLVKIKFSNILDLIKIVNNVNPLYPAKVFRKVYLVEKLNDSIIVKYDVKWEYYIE